jgi:hypothetical protein
MLCITHARRDVPPGAVLRNDGCGMFPVRSTNGSLRWRLQGAERPTHRALMRPNPRLMVAYSSSSTMNRGSAVGSSCHVIVKSLPETLTVKAKMLPSMFALEDDDDITTLPLGA